MKLYIQFDKVLDYFLTRTKKGQTLEYILSRKASVKDIIECHGVPHTEVGYISYNKNKIDFSYIPSTPGLLEVKCIESPFDVLSSSFLRPFPLVQIKFLADVNVMKLGRLLILMGFDVACSPLFTDQEIAGLAEAEARIILTRDTELLKRKKIIYAKRIKADYPYEQLAETIHFFDLENQISFFSKCTKCNRDLAGVSKEEVIYLLEPKTKKFYNTFFQCPRCNKVFWKGSHFDNIKKKFSSIGITINH